MIGKILQDNNKAKIFFPVLIFLIWLIVYLTCFFSWEHKIWWDENSYLTTARGIAENFDFGSRSVTVQGVIKYPFPQCTHHLPLYSTYVAVFFKLFGPTIEVAYFSTWLAGLVCCLFIYFTCLIVLEKKYILSFLSSICFLLSPRITHMCDSGMMEIPGAALLSILIFIVFRNLSLNKINPILFGLIALLLYLFKSLFVGVIFGFVLLMFFSYKDKAFFYKGSLIYSLSLCFGYVLFKSLFPPLAPMLNILSRAEGPEGTYANFAGGFFDNPVNNFLLNLELFYTNIISRYFNYSIISMKGVDPFYVSIPDANELAIYALAILFVSFFAIALWSKIPLLQRCFISFSLISVLSMNIIYVILFGGAVGLLCRYNLIYLPLIIISFAVIIEGISHYFVNMVSEHKKTIFLFILSIVILVYVPFYNAASTITILHKNMYHGIGYSNTEAIKKIVGGNLPKFIYFTSGNYSTWYLFPLRVVFMEATNEQIKKINLKLPSPIEFIFLTTSNNLFLENKEQILAGKPIIDNWYTFYSFDSDKQIVVYKFNPSGI